MDAKDIQKKNTYDRTYKIYVDIRLTFPIIYFYRRQCCHLQMDLSSIWPESTSPNMQHDQISQKHCLNIYFIMKMMLGT